MKEKEKGKFNPFVGELRPDEEILWLHSAPIPLSHDHTKRAEIPTLLFMLVLTLLASIFLSTKDFFVLGLLIIPLIFIAPLLLSWLWASILGRPLRVYAITNERLLTYDPNKTHPHKMSMLELQDLDARYESDGALSFNILYPRWDNVPDAKAVLRLIEKAAENRLNSLSQDQIKDEHENLEESITLENEVLLNRREAR